MLKDAPQDRDDDELNYALLPHFLVDSRWAGFPVKKRKEMTMENDHAYISMWLKLYLLCVCLLGLEFGTVFQLDWLYKTVFIAGGLLSYMSSI